MIIHMLVETPIQRESYPTDINHAKWVLVAPLLLEPSKKSAGRPRSVDMREIINAILYLSHSGCSWRMLPHDFPSWKTVHRYYNKWSKDGTLARISARLDIDLQYRPAENSA